MLGFPLGILSAAGAGGAAALASDYELISSTVLGSAAGSITFSGLGSYSSTYKHLQMRGVVRMQRSGQQVDNLNVRFNGNSSVAYLVHNLGADGTTMFSDSNRNLTELIFQNFSASTNTANAFTPFVMDILDPYSTTKLTTTRTLFGHSAANNNIRLTSGLWRNTSSITDITLFPGAGTGIDTFSRVSLYGLKG